MSYEKDNMKSTVVEELPDCDYCKQEGRTPPEKAEYDGKTKHGPWAYMCEEHFNKYGVGLGTGLGQKLVRPIRPECDHVWENKSYDLSGKTVYCIKCGETRRVELDSDLGGRLWFI